MKKYIGISGTARSGKNLLANLLIQQLDSEYNLKAEQFALATELKLDCQEFIRQKLNIDVFSENTEEKNLFRQMLVWYGRVMRKKTSGQYWIKKLEPRLLASSADVVLVTDIRYAEYENDELDWILNTLQGSLIHVQRSVDFNIIPPANNDEAINDPVLREMATHRIVWEDRSKVVTGRLEDDPYLISEVNKALKVIFNK
jgi:hypothetical protein